MHAPAGVWCALYPLPACSCTSILLWSHGVAVTVRYLGFVLQDGHTTVSWHQLSHWEECAKWEGFTASNYTAGSTTVSFSNPCDYFTVGACTAGQGCMRRRLHGLSMVCMPTWAWLRLQHCAVFHRRAGLLVPGQMPHGHHHVCLGFQL
eukprot:GHRQ01028032.1.p1 GENE.GHRQ01028032.1~~GHRQ01028032.1.p1  ORF type:complete len:172 (-),score=24.57 GHRQ01028032.1:1015-1461(-)